MVFASKIVLKWIGSYWYSHPDAVALGFVPVVFKMIVTRNWFWRISGSITDGQGGVEEPACFFGSAYLGRIRFVKQYSGPLVTQNNGISRRVPNASTSPFPVWYWGKIAEDGAEIAGDWMIKIESKIEIDQNPSFVSPILGRWKARLEETPN